MPAFEACLTEIRKAAGIELTDDELDTILTDILRRKAQAKERIRLSEDAQYAAAAAELAEQARILAAKEKAIRLQNLAKRVERRAFYETAPGRGRTPGPVMGILARLVGVNTQFVGARRSVGARGDALVRDYLNGMTAEFDRAGLFGAVRSGALDRQWARELSQLSDPNGQPGITGSKEALQIAQIAHKYQRLNVDNQNRQGAWIGDLPGYVARQSHDPDRLRRAGFQAWRDKILPKLDQDRTFAEIADPEDFLLRTYNALVTGTHLKHDGLQGFKDPAFKGPGNLAKRVSESRVLHFRDSDAWLDYHREFGNGKLIESVLRSLDHGARNAALMETFGTNPRAELEADIAWLKERHRDDLAVMDGLKKWEKPLLNRMDVLDGTYKTPVNRQVARIGAYMRVVQNITKLGGVAITSLADVGIKARALRREGVNLLEAYGDSVVALGRGRGRGEVREIMDLLRVAVDGMRADVASRFDVAADTLPGTMSHIQNMYFRYTGLNYWTDAQRGGAALLLSRNLGRQRAAAWDKLRPETRRGLEAAGIDAAAWDMLKTVSWRQANGRNYLTPDIAGRIDSGLIESHLRATGRIGKDASPDLVARMVNDFRGNLSLTLASYYSDRSDYAVIQPGANERAILLQGTRPGTPEGEALRLVAQFKAFPVAMVSRSWGAELYGGQGTASKVAGVVHMTVAGMVLGYMAMTAKDLLKGRTPRDPENPKTWVAAFLQGGSLGIYGDFLFGDFARFGGGGVETIMGPTASTVGDAFRLWGRIREGQDVSASAVRTLFNLTPGVGIFYIKPAFDYLVLYQVMEALNPGYLRRFEKRVEKENGQTFLISPSRAVPRGGGGLDLDAITGG